MARRTTRDKQYQVLDKYTNEVAARRFTEIAFNKFLKKRNMPPQDGKESDEPRFALLLEEVAVDEPKTEKIADAIIVIDEAPEENATKETAKETNPEPIPEAAKEEIPEAAKTEETPEAAKEVEPKTVETKTTKAPRTRVGVKK